MTAAARSSGRVPRSAPAGFADGGANGGNDNSIFHVSKVRLKPDTTPVFPYEHSCSFWYVVSGFSRTNLRGGPQPRPPPR